MRNHQHNVNITMQADQKNIRFFAIIFVILYSIGYYLWIDYTQNDISLRYSGGAFFSLLAPILASTFFYLNLKRFNGKGRNFWLILLASCISFFIAELIWRYQTVYLGQDLQFPGWADFFWIVNLLFYAFALLYKVYEKKRQFHGLHCFFDAFIIWTVVTTISWIYYLEPILDGKTLSTPLKYFSLGYPIGHLGVLLGITMLYLSNKHIFPPKVIILNLSGMISYIISDSIFFYEAIYDTYETYGLLSPVWSISLLVIGLSSFYDDENYHHKQQDKSFKTTPFLSSLRDFWPYLSILVLIIFAILRKDQLQSIIIGGLVILSLIALRQIITLMENQSLVKKLQQVNSSLEITKKKLVQSEQRYRSLFENHPDAILLFDLEGVIMDENKEARSLRNVTVLNQNHILIHFNKALHGESQYVENAILGRGEHKVNCSITFVPVWVDGVIVGVFGICQDKTEQKRTEELLRKSEKLTVVSQLAAGVAHEIRNPLTSIKGFLQLIGEGTFKTEYMHILQSELSRIELILDDFLTLAKPNQDTIFENTDLSQTLVQVVRLLEPHAVLRNVQVILRFDEELPPIECIENQIKQVFINIIKNAIEASEEKEQVLIVTKWMKENNKVSILFKDDGCGISEERIHRLGEPFYSNKEKGTGLGLMMSYKILEHHKGTIQFSSIVGKGTEVRLTLPILQ